MDSRQIKVDTKLGVATRARRVEINSPGRESAGDAHFPKKTLWEKRHTSRFHLTDGDEPARAGVHETDQKRIMVTCTYHRLREMQGEAVGVPAGVRSAVKVLHAPPGVKYAALFIGVTVYANQESRGSVLSDVIMKAWNLDSMLWK